MLFYWELVEKRDKDLSKKHCKAKVEQNQVAGDFNPRDC